MDIVFRARNVEVPEGLRRTTLERVARLAGRYGAERAVVCFFAERNPRIAEREVCEITLFRRGRIVRAQMSATAPSVAAERVLVKLQHRAGRLHGRQTGRRYDGCTGSVHFPPHRHPAAGDRDGAGGFGDILGGGVSAGETNNVMTKDCRTEPMSPEEAALQMAGRDGDIYFFINAETARTAAVYRRPDGNVGLIDVGSRS